MGEMIPFFVESEGMFLKKKTHPLKDEPFIS
jgi:hypothetical protein